ncbi:MAG: CcoQ/FixQ family Cbb3-type cytochrome c oxidase assembly chaperone [Candidatus Marinimicrobia bacterium]|jgi:hypothetical protein|nr:CcoQ/FixQ family Cbb3-type cytochrome c oxidase assembly chaperone [Candidatus Neomarinimicrobiota bacterium]MBT3635199.1 CcoQ/FixQ family Cbb3-type cytochrome c oxidase assembly chaperone [Candidatus Neomarinimicrobiota bacterium]MBT3683945.1 CcoQ/FixQ family Cbb3-type cytochrome c oxidase assembly chaperone [Candidatus Neomarinimicrobiota bacterium]MBT3760890.1 CcoQ/FixQ family Cbb3-type cytochrome c oxidase assembly chaperone [Candidatus Neomarinimicrobiota bacterium]MBT3896938.1 CcoQ/Fix
MIRHIFSPESGVGVFPIISLIIFLLIFAGVMYWVVTMKKPFIEKMSSLPLDSDNISQKGK